MSNNGKKAVSKNGKTAPGKYKTLPTVLWKIDQLKPHPKQAEHFGDMTAAELDALARDIETRGLDHPIVIVPDGTIVMGHQRIRACQNLGWTEVPVVVDRELAKKGDAAVEEALIRDNLMRSHRSKLTIARLYQRLLELKQANPSERLFPGEEKETYDLIAKIIGDKSGRTMNRYRQILRTPVEVQKAFDDGELTIGQACAVDRLLKDIQQEIAREIRQGANAKDVVKRMLATFSQRKSPDATFSSFMTILRRGLQTFGSVKVKEIRCVKNMDLKVLMEGAALVQRLRQHGNKIQRLRDKVKV